MSCSATACRSLASTTLRRSPALIRATAAATACSHCGAGWLPSLQSTWADAAEGPRSGARDADVISDARAVEKLAQPLFRRGEPVLACRERYLRGLAPSGQPFAAPDPGQRRGMRQAAQQVTGISDGDGADSQPVRHPLACAIVL